jgi:chromosome partitioning protein
MQARVIAVANQKGGVGKTTTAVNLAACLVERRKKVLLIDLDPQGNATSAVGLDKLPGDSVYQVLLGGGDLAARVRPTAYKNFDVIPSELDLAGAEVELIRSDDPFLRLRRAIEPLRAAGTHEYIFIDCPPSLGALTMNALCAADGVLIPLQCEYFALEGLSVIAQMVSDLHAGANPAIDIDGIVMTMYSGRTKLGQQVVQEVVRHFPDKVYETLIPRTVRLGEAPSFGKPIIVYDRTGIGATAYRLLAREFIRRHEGPPPAVVPDEPAAAAASRAAEGPPAADPGPVPASPGPDAAAVPAAPPAPVSGDDPPVV